MKFRTVSDVQTNTVNLRHFSGIRTCKNLFFKSIIEKMWALSAFTQSWAKGSGNLFFIGSRYITICFIFFRTIMQPLVYLCMQSFYFSFVRSDYIDFFDTFSVILINFVTIGFAFFIYALPVSNIFENHA